MNRWISIVAALGVVGALGTACGGSDGSGLGSDPDGGIDSGGAGGSSGNGGSSGSSGSAGSSGSSGSGGSSGTAGGGGSGGGGECDDSGDCAAPTPVCNPLPRPGACVECLFDVDCGTGERCENMRCEAVTTCSNSLDCTAAKPICDTSTGICEQCVSGNDCDGDATCENNRCVTVQACGSSLDCNTDQVCDPATSRCVECVQPGDCSADSAECVDNECVVRTECTSDKQCTPLGQLCDTSAGYCVECIGDSACPDVYHCAAGTCELDVCAEGEGRCVGNAVLSCNESGDGFNGPTACASRQTCVPDGNGARCRDWVCTAGQIYCDGQTAIECSADGFSVLTSTDCDQSGKVCVNGECKDQLCQPNQDFCDGSEVKTCNGDGTNATVSDTCTSQEYCDEPSASCKTVVCQPSQPACNGDIATTCNGDGSGYQSGGTDCSASGKTCSAGTCQDCPGGNGAQSSVRLDEINVGTEDYVVLKNTDPQCTANIQGMQLVVRVAASPVETLTFTLPSHDLDPGETVTIVETNAAAGEILMPNTIIWTPESQPGHALLCDGPCSTVTNVIDAFAYRAGTTQPPALPNPVTFTPLQTGITMATEDTKSWRRTAYAGSYPGFVGGDWVVGDATRSSTSGMCPVSQPANGSTCTNPFQSCAYGGVTCTCNFITWDCQ